MSIKTIDDCSLIKEYMKFGVSKPKQEDGKCEGYGHLAIDNKHFICERCPLKFSKMEKELFRNWDDCTQNN